MTATLQNIISVIAAGVVLLLGVFILRFVFKFAWRFLRTALIIFSVLLIAGFLLGVVNINF
mgnify:CR=1 FL=1